jgi:hypothetical protein
MSTQWRVGYAGATGLDYASLPPVMEMCGIDADARRSVFADVRVIEREALSIMAKRSKPKK